MSASLYPPPKATPTVTTTGLTAATDFTVVSFYGSKINGVCMVHCYVTYTPSPSTDTLPPTANNANIADTLMCTLPEDYWPPNVVNFTWGDGTVDGEGYINTTGGVRLRTISTDQVMPTGRNIRVTSTFIQ
ncbi:hypothetical protein SEA_DIANE_23 [Streptomyces phage Diane]|uniref:Uncharacterized protein n=1 Tax=Streptomyces phage Diane TaxID=2041207 RepID=A0A291LHH2_9CAUD|nr:hypothetical protein KGG78_gp23 [Streptomyces phage Diane]ATI18807.1 hypothetical protein SEA_DIANE_23 [Streptomyces phage Diane]